VAEFLDTFDIERSGLLTALGHFETVWSRFQERRTLDIDTDDTSESLIASELSMVRNELESTRFTVGVFGLIKRGKSTLLNALIGREVSAMRVTPETAVPVYVSYGETPEAIVHFADGTRRHIDVDEVHRYTSQKENANNRLGVTHVEQQVPVGFLRNGTRLIDTPGLDDAEADEVYTERTLQELDIVDAGVVVFLSPPTVGATEMRFLTDVVSRDLRKTFLVCNMFPQHFHDRETRNEILSYIGSRIVEASRRAGRTGEVRIYPVCALEAWQARQTDDIDLWKRSGADRLLRELELYLSDVAGTEVLTDAAERITKAAEMAKAEVQVRQQLLEDPRQLSSYREQVDANIRGLESQFEQAVSRALADLGPVKMQVRGRLLSTFQLAKRKVEDCRTIADLEQFAAKFRREVEVSGEIASREFSDGFRAVVERLRKDLQERFQAVMTDVAPNLPQVHLSSGALLLTPDQAVVFQQAATRSKQAGRTGLVAGGVAGGGAAFVAAGALLGPIGLLGGALVGWKLSSMMAGQSSLDRAKLSILQRLDEISNHLLRDLDEQVSKAVDTVRAGVDRRRRAFAADLYQQFDLVQGIVADPTLLETYRRDAERFVQAFDACAVRAQRAVGILTVGEAVADPVGV
jgi:GTPase SAR1 family protein